MTTGALTPQLRQELAAALERERTRLAEVVQALAAAGRALAESQGEESDVGGAPGDVASDLVEQEVDLTLERAARGQLAEVEAALERLAEDRYGVCESCGDPVGVERLRALPWARRCRRCADRLARPPAPPALAE